MKLDNCPFKLFVKFLSNSKSRKLLVVLEQEKLNTFCKLVRLLMIMKFSSYLSISTTERKFIYFDLNKEEYEMYIIIYLILLLPIISVVVPDVLHIVKLIRVLGVVIVGRVAASQWRNRSRVTSAQRSFVQLVQHVLRQRQVVLLLHLRSPFLVGQLKQKFMISDICLKGFKSW